MRREKAYSKLADIRDRKGIDVREQLLKIAMSEDDVPDDVVYFINSQSDLDPEFIKVLKSKRLYSTLMNTDKPAVMAKALNSFITHVLIEFERSPEMEENIRENIDLDEILHAIREYVIRGNVDYLINTTEYVRDLLSDAKFS